MKLRSQEFFLSKNDDHFFLITKSFVVEQILREICNL